MGTYNKGILGPFSGKVGTVVGANWRGKDILRSLPKKTSRTPSEVQLLQQQKFTTVSEFLAPIAAVLAKYFGLGSGEITRRNQAMSYHMKEAVVFNDPDFELDYTKVLIAKGDLVGVQNPSVTALGTNQLRYTWDNNAGQGSAKDSDQLVVVVFAPAIGQYFYSLNAGIRTDGNTAVDLPSYFTGQEVQSWITFVAADQKRYATSVYLQGVVVT